MRDEDHGLKSIALDTAEELFVLRDKVEQYEGVLHKAAPRLAAFKQLEELARERRTTPEALAAEAAMEVLRQEYETLRQAVDQTAAQRNDLQGEITMLLQNKQDNLQIVDDLRIEHDDLHQEVGQILDELQLLRNDAVRLMTARRDLELQIAALKSELTDMQERRNGGTLGSDGSLTKTPQFGLDEDDDTEGRRLFDKFFHAKVEHDKARDWILR